MKSIILEKVVGTKAKVRILSFLYNFCDFDYSISDIAKECDIHWNTSQKELPLMVELGLLTESRIKGNQTHYRAIKNEIYTAFTEFENRVTDKLQITTPSNNPRKTILSN